MCVHVEVASLKEHGVFCQEGLATTRISKVMARSLFPTEFNIETDRFIDFHKQFLECHEWSVDTFAPDVSLVAEVVEIKGRSEPSHPVHVV